jgi:sulfate adenylyltransferase subunit 1 (EFTu-like GTPase family)
MGDLEEAFAPMSITLVLDDEIDISRGDVLASGGMHQSTAFTAQMVWMDERPLDPRRVYLLKQATRRVTAEVDRELVLNQIGPVGVIVSRPLVFDAYAENRGTGSFVLIDPATNFTAGAGMIVGVLRERHMTAVTSGAAERLAHLARTASTDADAVRALRQALEEMLI